MMTQSLFLIWSNEHGAWCRPNHNGYTKSIAQAGLYTHAAAIEICRRALIGSGVIPNELPVSADDLENIGAFDRRPRAIAEPGDELTAAAYVDRMLSPPLTDDQRRRQSEISTAATAARELESTEFGAGAGLSGYANLPASSSGDDREPSFEEK